MNEKLIEKKLREAVKQKGGLALKFISPGTNGVPDRIILMPGGRIWFREIKTTGKKPTERQRVMIGILRKLGFSVDVIDDEKTLNEFINAI